MNILIKYHHNSYTVILNERIDRYDNGSVQLYWRLPRELHNKQELVIEVYVNGEWVPVRYHDNIPHIQTHLEGDSEQQIQLRLRLFGWEGYAVILIPPLPEPPTTVAQETSSSDAGSEVVYFNDVGLIYGIVFAVLVMACATVLIVILILKYIQMTRRDSDKG